MSHIQVTDFHMKLSFSYMGVGLTCIRFPGGKSPPIGNGSVFSDAVGGCGLTGDLVFSPSDLTQNAVVKAALAIWVVFMLFLVLTYQHGFSQSYQKNLLYPNMGKLGTPINLWMSNPFMSPVSHVPHETVTCPSFKCLYLIISSSLCILAIVLININKLSAKISCSNN